MILVDANILLYAYHTRSEHHTRCRAWLEDALTGQIPLRLAWFTITAFVRISTSAQIFEEPLSIREAADAVSSWLAAPAVSLLQPGERYWEILRELMHDAQVSGPLVMDAALAALALEHGATLCTSDRSFRRFPSLKTTDPTQDGVTDESPLASAASAVDSSATPWRRAAPTPAPMRVTP